MNVARDDVHLLVDKLDPSQLAALRGLLAVMVGPHSSIDDEPETEYERHAVAEATEWLKHNQPIPFEDVLADFGLTVEDIKNYKESS